MVRDDAANKVGVGVSQCGHELGERLLVELSYCTKHALFGFVGGTKGCLIHSCHLVQAHDTVDWWGDGENWLEQEDLVGSRESTVQAAVATMWLHDQVRMDGKESTHYCQTTAVQQNSIQSLELPLVSADGDGVGLFLSLKVCTYRALYLLESWKEAQSLILFTH